MSDRVLVTGISGFIGGHVALALLAAGFVVRGSLRNLQRAAQLRHALQAAGGDVGRLEFVQLDLRDDAGWRDAAAGCRYLQHVASPLMARPSARRDDLVLPALEGTRRALAAGLAAGVERIVVTSSAAAVAYGHPRGRTAPFTDADWSQVGDDDITPYTEGKTLAELQAWTMMEEAGRRDDLAAINPTVVLGPLLDDDPGTSALLIKRLLDGSVPVAPRVHFGLVDVRDIAALHVLAMQRPEAGGRRFLASAATLSLIDVARLLRAGFPAHARRAPRFEAPDWLVRLYGLFDAEVAANLHALGVVHQLDCSSAIALLGRPFLPPRVACAATAQSLIDRRLL
jgi:nucleoside-diphosphate-sugar epimerase